MADVDSDEGLAAIRDAGAVPKLVKLIQVRSKPQPSVLSHGCCVVLPAYDGMAFLVVTHLLSRL
eukprot:scaffold22313_cov40-Prasinocladus_malaysianus.AAC.3